MKNPLATLSNRLLNAPGAMLKTLQAVDQRSWFRVFESFPGAWQRNVVVDKNAVLSYFAVYACITLIAQDIGKMRIKLVQQQNSGIWKEVPNNPSYTPVLRKPNHFQTRIKFIEYWISSKLIHGNAYVLKARDSRNVVTAMYVLDPCRVKVLVSDSGEVFYRLYTDNLASIEDDIIVPAREIMHDLMVPMFHPLCGVTPIFASGMAAMKGTSIESSANLFFANRSQPGGILSAPGAISDDTAKRLKDHWDNNFTGANAGKVAVIGDGLKYERLTVNAVDAQLIEQLKLSAEMVCSAFHVPPYMIGVGQMPAYNNIEALNQQYYTQCLQSLIESLELTLDEGLSLVTPTNSFGVEMDLKALLRMDTSTRYKSHSDAISGGWLAPNEARLDEDLEPAVGGGSPMMQQQNFSLEALAERDANKPFAKPATATPPPPAERSITVNVAPTLALPAPEPAPAREAEPVEQKMVPMSIAGIDDLFNEELAA